jgi:hypothetical protein
MQCQSCGYRNQDDAVICASCGERLSAPVQQYIPPAQPPSNPGSGFAPPVPSSSPPPYSPPPGAGNFQGKHQYMAYIRSNTAWPFYRGTINTIATLGYCWAALVGVAGLVTGLGAMNGSPGVGLLALIAAGLVAAIIYYGVSFWKEAALMIADIGDSITDANFREFRKE